MALPARAEDGYALWLRHAPLEGEALARLKAFNPQVAVPLPHEDNPTLEAAVRELNAGLDSLLGHPGRHRPERRGRVELDCGSHPVMGNGSFAIRSAPRSIRISGASHVSCLYGAFALLRELGLGADPAKIELAQTPAMPLRMLNHWDNPDGSVERGYSGRSIFDWWRLPGHLDARMIDYARANASLGINAVAVNNVNAKSIMLTAPYIAKLKRLADAWRPYGIRVYLSARWSAPRDLGGLETADPLDPRVAAWWQGKAREIYASIPDFGGFLVKANSEGQPGPQDYGRTHADGANMLAKALGSRGTVIWRAFVYQSGADTDRAMLAYDEFKPLDGKFAPNVIVQVKNGPIDFQPREPFHPLFGAMPKTRLMLELQITKEYLGQGTHLTYLAPLWKEAIDADTGHGARKAPLSVAQAVQGGGMAGVANTGSDRNWSGTHFDQANWYAFGRLAWDPSLGSAAIAREWAAQTFSRDPAFLAGVLPIMLASRQAEVDFMTPLGLAHQFATGHHYGPGPWVNDLGRPEWNPTYYHRADKDGIGFDRTASGSTALAQYAPPIAARWADPRTIDEDYLLWFHHLPWDFRTRSGRPLWDELVLRYDRGVAAIDAMARQWAALGPYVDPERFRDTAEFLTIQQADARLWRDASLAYYMSVSGRPLPAGVAPPVHDLDWYKAQIPAEGPGQ